MFGYDNLLENVAYNGSPDTLSCDTVVRFCDLSYLSTMTVYLPENSLIDYELLQDNSTNIL